MGISKLSLMLIKFTGEKENHEEKIYRVRDFDNHSRPGNLSWYVDQLQQG
jgi:hypothetical protein